MDTGELFRELTGFEPYDYQLRAWENIKKVMKNGGKVVIEVPTAGGKTETAVMPFLSGVYNNSWPVARLVYVLPTRSLVEKQTERLRELVSKLLQLKGKSEEKAKKLAKEVVVVEYGLEKTHAFLGWIVVTTWDAFLYGLAAHRTVGSRFTFPAGAIAQSLVVFDEVQMYQDESMYMPRLLSLVAGILENANVPVVVMSATIPSKLREMIAGNTEIITVRENDKNKPSRGNVKVRVVEGDIGKVLNGIRSVLEEGKRVLVVRNTVEKAVETYRLLKEGLNLNDPSNTLLIHGRFTIGDRREKEKALDSARLIVATQVVEAGLDLPKVGLVVTDIAPLDALIQRIGRCARRPEEEGKGIILIPVEDSIESEKVVRGLSELKKKVGKDNVVFATVTTTREYGRVAEVHYGEDKKDFVYVSDVNTARKLLKKKTENKKKKPKLPKDLYIIPYSTAPYDPLVMLTTYDELSNLEGYIENTTKAREALDRVYRFHYENNIVPKEFASAYVYFKELKLFSAPPEYELRSRPELYVMLYPTSSEKLEKLERDKIIRVSYDKNKLHKWKKEGIIVGKLGELWDKTSRKNVGWEIQKAFTLSAYGIYAVNPNYYTKEFGFVVNERDQPKN